MTDKSGTTEIALLAQRLRALENQDAIQDVQLQELQKDSNNLKGKEQAREKAANSAAQWIKPITTLVMALAVFIGGTIIFGGLEAAKEDIKSLETDAAERFTRKDDRLLSLESLNLIDHKANVLARFAKNEEVKNTLRGKKAPSLSDVKSAIHELEKSQVETRTSLATITEDLRGDEGKFTELSADVVALQAEMKGFAAITAEHEEEIDAAETKISSIERGHAATRASTRAALVEVETQLRAVVDIENQRDAFNRQVNSLLWNKLNPDNQFPDSDFFPENVPARATTTTGQINGNGH